MRFSSLWHYFKNGEEEKKNDMIAFMEEGGWQYVTSCGFLHIFETEDESAVPLETDAVTTIMALHKTMWKTVILPVVLIVAAGVLFVGMQIQSLLTSPLFSFGGDEVNWALMVMALFVLSAIAGIVFLISYFNWYRKAVRIAKEENAVTPFTAFPSLAITFGLFYFEIIIIWTERLVFGDDSAMYRILLIFMGILTALLSLLQYKVNHQKSSMQVVRRSIILVGLCIVCCGIALFVPSKKKDNSLPIEQAPLVKADFGDTGSLQYLSAYKQNFLFDRLDVNQYEGDDQMFSFGYTYINCHLEILEDALFNDLLQWMERSHGGVFVESDPEAYSVDTLYVHHDDRYAYLFRNGKDMACVTFDFQPTDEQLQYALDVLCDWN